jgi:hypothetical protein
MIDNHDGNTPSFFFADSEEFLGDSQKSPGLGIEAAFKNIIPNGSVELEWYHFVTGHRLAQFSIRDERLFKGPDRSLTLIIQLLFLNGDDKCKIQLFGENRVAFIDLVDKFEPITQRKVTKKQLIKIIQKVIDVYQIHIVKFHLRQYIFVKEDFSNFRSDYQKFDKYLQWIYKLKKHQTDRIL